MIKKIYNIEQDQEIGKVVVALSCGIRRIKKAESSADGNCGT